LTASLNKHWIENK